MDILIGIDDAGRGPVIGPMVLAGVLIEKKDEPKLAGWGVKDSKKLTPLKREEIAKKILKNFKTCVELAFPDEIDSRGKAGTNLNRIEAVKAARIINVLIKDQSEKVKVIVDCPSPNTESWKNYLALHVERKEIVEFIIEHKADVNHICCSAASIIAKTTRDSEIEKIKKEFNIEFGSGYCSDPVTCKFLEENIDKFGDKGIIRKSWDTYDKVKAKQEQKKLEF
ncbi:MAG: ribonuclease HII [Nanoarchaeota archaeon]|nr:ribonuclease HII [Nanoarchaeota archaeon]